MALYEEWLEKDGLTKIEAWARNGLTDEQIAHNIGIETRTLYRWKDKYSQICHALKKGKAVVDFEVENALLKRAMGYTVVEQFKERVYNEETKKYEMVIVRETVKEVQPDTTAQIFWLKNRKPVYWRDKQEVEHSGEIQIPNVVIKKVGV